MRAIILTILLSFLVSCSQAPASVVTLKWDESPESDVVGYNIYRKEESVGKFIKINSILISEPRFTDSAVDPGQAYSYRVTAVNFSGMESDFSEEIHAQAK